MKAEAGGQRPEAGGQEVKGSRRFTPPVPAAITGTGMSVPRHVLTNADLEKMVDTSDEWIVQRTGISQRYVSRDGETTTTLATEAVRKALDDAELQPSDLDLLICATMTPDMVCPATACQVVSELGAVPCGAMDMNLACTGFVAALNTAANFVASRQCRHVAVVGAEQLSRIVDWTDRRTCILFGDGAGAAIISPPGSGDGESLKTGCLHQEIHSDGSRWRDLYCSRSAIDPPAIAAADDASGTLQMNGREVYKFAVTTLHRCIRDAMEACDLTADDVSVIVPHQSNTRILDSAREKLGLPEEKMYVNLPRYGNTSAASVGICLAELSEQCRLGEGDVVIFVGLGGGLTWATSVWRL